MKPLLKTHMFGQIGLCESRRADSPDTKAEWGIYWALPAISPGTFASIYRLEDMCIRDDRSRGMTRYPSSGTSSHALP